MQDFTSSERARYFDGPLDDDDWGVPTDEDLYQIEAHEDTGDVLEVTTLSGFRNTIDQDEILLGDLPVHFNPAEWRPVWVSLSPRQ